MTGTRRRQRGSTSVDTMIPWSSPPHWKAVNDALGGRLERYSRRLAPARQHAEAIAHQFDLLGGWFDHLAADTCRVCPEPCCRHAKVWLDFKDLLFIHLQESSPPPHQLRRNLREPCRYLGCSGCTLPRPARPWVCTWYVCPAQRQAIARDIPGGMMRMEAARARVKDRRQAMVGAFLAALAGVTDA